MTDDAGHMTAETPDGNHGAERLARTGEQAQPGAGPPSDPGNGGGSVVAAPAVDSAPATDSTSPGSFWPAVTVAFLAVAAWVPVVLTFLQSEIGRDPFVSHTENVFGVLALVGAPATIVLAAGAAGLHPRLAGSRGVRIAATAVTGAQLLILAVIAVLQLFRETLVPVVVQTRFTLVALALTAGVVLLALATARAHGSGTATAFWHRAPVIGLVGAILGQTVLAVGRTLQFAGDLEGTLVAVLSSVFMVAATMTGLWLVGRGRPAAGWTGAAMLCLLAVLWLGSMINMPLALDVPPALRATEIVQYLLHLAGTVTAVLAARAIGRAARAGRSFTQPAP